ncbi:MAG: hypothetical protein PUP90_27540 [Nostoc sp. S4]|nr:hypothetical protein [Nostoc sp. S4]
MAGGRGQKAQGKTITIPSFYACHYVLKGVTTAVNYRGRQELGGSLDRTSFTAMHEKGISPTPYTPHPTPFFKSVLAGGKLTANSCCDRRELRFKTPTKF